MKYAVQIASGAMIYKTNFMKISSGVQNLLGEETHTDTKVTWIHFYFSK
jgi:hypothetical protein